MSKSEICGLLIATKKTFAMTDLFDFCSTLEYLLQSEGQPEYQVDIFATKNKENSSVSNCGITISQGESRQSALQIGFTNFPLMTNKNSNRAWWDSRDPHQLCGPDEKMLVLCSELSEFERTAFASVFELFEFTVKSVGKTKHPVAETDRSRDFFVCLK